MQTIPKIKTLTELVSFLINGQYQEVLSQIPYLEIAAEDVLPYIFWNPVKYTRNCIKRTEEFELLLLCWEPGQASSIHSHNEQECWVKIVEGSFKETVYEYNKKTYDMVEVKSYELANTDISNMSSNLLFHSLANESSKRAISLHLYIKPITNCEVYNSVTKKIDMYSTSYHSYKGKCI